ncbi:N-acetylmuramoyl-L-alanine amidase [Cyanobium sp. ATX 6A2]|uniref:N-acetylmuramoyl-L-alanine amidase n=1 Tax=Cyanobium sp. ATX 6A2 TaxID=2823700 RepID=UPI0020CEC2CC|nr:N-acetylmuramoyl-L-alanine amidase [Cyanobium sp. ATX 6A2]MCP9887003.1 N-acetylmuramoyl-L-alanine amidase [Cyanobium sp. ATX 6A2]
MPATIYLHWAATPYSWVRSGLYHTIIGGDGTVHRLHAYSIDLPAHTWRRNSNSIALSCACMGGRPDPWTIPPTEVQLDALCREAASVASSWGWREGDITIQRVMTHAEAASNRDGRRMHDNYGPVIWGGTGERWDFLQLSKGGPPTGGEELRGRIRRFLAAPDGPAGSGAGKPGSASSAAGAAPGAPVRLEFRRATTMSARGETLAVELDANGSSWALAADLLALYEIPYEWDASRRRVLVGSLDVVPTFRDDQVQPGVGWPLFEMTLQNGNAPVVLRGILRDNRAWCRVLEFAEEFGISATFEPFTLLERRGG